MASIRQCDRCGKPYDKNECNALYNGHHHLLSGFYLYDDDDNVLEASRTDLCDDCLTALDKWMIEGGENNGEGQKVR